MITYDKIEEDDYNILTKIMIEAFNDDTRMHTDLQSGGPLGYDDGTLIRTLNTQKSYLSQKICIGGEIVGAYVIKLGDEEHGLEMLFLNPTIKNAGIGYKVWQHIEDTYSQVKVWKLETPDYSKRNQHFYEKCGFLLVGEKTYTNGGKSFSYKKHTVRA